MVLSQFRSEIYKNAMKIGLKSLNAFQSKSIPSILNSQSSVLLSEPGSGKSMSYILGLSQSISIEPGRKSPFYLNSTSVETLFTKPSALAKGASHGALILVPTQELSLQIYKYFRQVAPWLNTCRTNSSLSDISGSIKYINDSNANEESIKTQGFHNLAMGIEWEFIDILVSTPRLLSDIIDFKVANNAPTINPRSIVIDEMDILLE